MGSPVCWCACTAVVNKERNARGSQAPLSPQSDYPQERNDSMSQEHNDSMPRSILRVKQRESSRTPLVTLSFNEGGQVETDVPESDQNCNGNDDGAPLLQRLQQKSLRSAATPARAPLSTPQVCECRLTEFTSFWHNFSDQNPNAQARQARACKEPNPRTHTWEGCDRWTGMIRYPHPSIITFLPQSPSSLYHTRIIPL